MKIIFLIRNLVYGGAERQLVALAREFHRRGHPVTILVFYPDIALKQELKEAGIPVISLDKRGRWDIIGFILRLVRLLRRERPDILHSYLVTPNILTALLKPMFPQISMVWGVRVSRLKLARYNWFVRLSYVVERILAPLADLIIVNSFAGREAIISHGFPENKIMVIPNGIDTELFRPDLKLGKRVRSEWGVSDNQKLIGLVGRLDSAKDHQTFLKAAVLLAREYEDVRFVCVGDGPADYRQELHALGRSLGLTGRLIWAGARGDMTSVYNALDIASSSSSGEGFSNVIAEAMACGVPCVVTEVGDSARIVGETGVVVPPGNAERLAVGWSNVLSHSQGDYLSIAHASRRRIISEYNMEALFNKSIEALSVLL